MELKSYETHLRISLELKEHSNETDNSADRNCNAYERRVCGGNYRDNHERKRKRQRANRGCNYVYQLEEVHDYKADDKREYDGENGLSNALCKEGGKRNEGTYKSNDRIGEHKRQSAAGKEHNELVAEDRQHETEKCEHKTHNGRYAKRLGKHRGYEISYKIKHEEVAENGKGYRGDKLDCVLQNSVSEECDKTEQCNEHESDRNREVCVY